MQPNTATNVVKADCRAFGMGAGNTRPVRVVKLKAHGLERQVTRFHPVNIGIVDFRDQDCVRVTIFKIHGARRL